MDIHSFSIDKLCRLFLIHSMLYYEYDTSVINDYQFDLICKALLDKTFKIGVDIPEEPVYYRKYITKEALESGSGHHINFKSLPQRIHEVVNTLRTGRDILGNHIDLVNWLK